MLLFINILDVYEYLGAAFQYISCYSLSPPNFLYSKLCIGFNTSHVTLYHVLEEVLEVKIDGFNTSHVTLYQAVHGRDLCGENSFNTSHVTLYHHMLTFRSYLYKFQYISCYSLSIYSRVFYRYK